MMLIMAEDEEEYHHQQQGRKSQQSQPQHQKLAAADALSPTPSNSSRSSHNSLTSNSDHYASPTPEQHPASSGSGSGSGTSGKKGIRGSVGGKMMPNLLSKMTPRVAKQALSQPMKKILSKTTAAVTNTRNDNAKPLDDDTEHNRIAAAGVDGGAVDGDNDLGGSRPTNSSSGNNNNNNKPQSTNIIRGGLKSAGRTMQRTMALLKNHDTWNSERKFNTYTGSNRSKSITPSLKKVLGGVGGGGTAAASGAANGAAGIHSAARRRETYEVMKDTFASSDDFSIGQNSTWNILDESWRSPSTSTRPGLTSLSSPTSATAATAIGLKESLTGLPVSEESLMARQKDLDERSKDEFSVSDLKSVTGHKKIVDNVMMAGSPEDRRKRIRSQIQNAKRNRSRSPSNGLRKPSGVGLYEMQAVTRTASGCGLVQMQMSTRKPRSENNNLQLVSPPLSRQQQRRRNSTGSNDDDIDASRSSMSVRNMTLDDISKMMTVDIRNLTMNEIEDMLKMHRQMKKQQTSKSIPSSSNPKNESNAINAISKRGGSNAKVDNDDDDSHGDNGTLTDVEIAVPLTIPLKESIPSPTKGKKLGRRRSNSPSRGSNRRSSSDGNVYDSSDDDMPGAGGTTSVVSAMTSPDVSLSNRRKVKSSRRQRQNSRENMSVTSLPVVTANQNVGEGITTSSNRSPSKNKKPSSNRWDAPKGPERRSRANRNRRRGSKSPTRKEKSKSTSSVPKSNKFMELLKGATSPAQFGSKPSVAQQQPNDKEAGEVPPPPPQIQQSESVGSFLSSARARKRALEERFTKNSTWNKSQSRPEVGKNHQKSYNNDTNMSPYGSSVNGKGSQSHGSLLHSNRPLKHDKEARGRENADWGHHSASSQSRGRRSRSKESQAISKNSKSRKSHSPTKKRAVGRRKKDSVTAVREDIIAKVGSPQRTKRKPKPSDRQKESTSARRSNQKPSAKSSIGAELKRAIYDDIITAKKQQGKNGDGGGSVSSENSDDVTTIIEQQIEESPTVLRLLQMVETLAAREDRIDKVLGTVTDRLGMVDTLAAREDRIDRALGNVADRLDMYEDQLSVVAQQRQPSKEVGPSQEFPQEQGEVKEQSRKAGNRATSFGKSTATTEMSESNDSDLESDVSSYISFH